MVDFCYLVNPCFPSEKLLTEMKANFETLVRAYPSGQRINNLLAAKYYGIKQENIFVGNGASELIKEIITHLPGRIGVISPSFDEYRNRCPDDNLCVFNTDKLEYAYSKNDLIEFFTDKSISTLVLVNPDNPTGNFIAKDDLLELANWAHANKILLILDESFSDFAESSTPVSLLDQNIIENNDSIIVIKSISKSFGVPGIRLGVLATTNIQILSIVRKNLAVWNINSFGEFFLQIIEKYQSDYKMALQEFRAIRNNLINELQTVKFLKLLPSQSNFIMCKVNYISAKTLCTGLLSNHKILVKDLSGKKGIAPREYIRIAVRNKQDNEKLLSALRSFEEEISNLKGLKQPAFP